VSITDAEVGAQRCSATTFRRWTSGGWEGADAGLYSKIRLRVQTLEGDALAWVYVLDGYEGGLPSCRYLGVLADAAESAGAPTDYVADLRSWPCRNVGP